MPSTISIEIRSDVATPMSDGTILYSDLFLPAGNDPHPTILQRTPYDKASALSQQMLDPISAAKSGYSVVIQDVRGRYSSEGIFYPFSSLRSMHTLADTCTGNPQACEDTRQDQRLL